MNPNDTATISSATGLNRREFLRVSSAAAAAGALASAGCQVPQEATVPFHDMPESLVDGMGRARFYHTVLDGSPVLVRTREGRPVLVAPSPADTSGRGLSVRHHAALMDLYDPDRARGPLSIRRGSGAPVASSWPAIGAELLSRLKAAGTKAVLLTGPIDSPAVTSVIAGLSARTGLRHVVWTPIGFDAAAQAWTRAFGDARTPKPRLDKADLVLGLGAEFLDRPEDGGEREFAERRSPDDGRLRMSRFVQLEGRLTLTGANADTRLRVRDSRLADVGAALAHELIVVRKLGPLAGRAEVVDALTPYRIDEVATRNGLDATVLKGLAGELAGASGHAVVVAGGSASGSSRGAAIELAAILLNVTLGAFDAGLFDESAGREVGAGSAEPLASVVEDMRRGSVELLLVAGANPVYDAPPAFGFADAIAKVPFVISLNDRIDETSQRADLLAPLSHPFESWSDARLPKGLFAVQQPVIRPLFDTRGLLDVLVDVAAAVGDPAASAALAAATAKVPVPAANTAAPAPIASVAWHYLRAAWLARVGSNGFDAAWNEILRTGSWQGPVPAAPRREFQAASVELLRPDPTPSDGIELQLYPHLALADGRRGNNAWLHELPDPITRITWGGALSIAPRRFDELLLTDGDFVEIALGDARVVVPAYRHAGMHDDQVALPLGLGRTACGPIGANVGPNAFALRQLAGGSMISAGIPITLHRQHGHEPLALAQGASVLNRAERPVAPLTTLTAYEDNAKAGTEQDEGGPSAWAAHDYGKTRWAMAIDLSKCNGCGKCVIGCQAENNVPVVGRHGILQGRPMSWIRIDRYYDAPEKAGGWDDAVWNAPLEVVEEPRTIFEPMLCQHCENAPCETVCPFVATMHSEDGLNQQVYNRCVGTRYCANNCPFKVRRFNFWEFSTKQESTFFRWLVPSIAKNADLNTRAPMQMKNNPEVTVRSRGVMEKCSFCIQRIRAARAEAIRDGRSGDALPDGAVVPACMEACPTGAITFGNVNDPGSRVAAQAASPRAMRLLDALGVKPSISYLTKVRNDTA